jgi:hypothetical protein
MEMWHWLVHTDAGLAARIGGGVAMFFILAILDLRKNHRKATRWREYLFLLACAAAAMIYGVVNDQITSRISWEYFYFGKGLDTVLGPVLPPDAGRLHYEAIKVGMKATWTVGLIIGVALLLANNPRRDRLRLSYRRMFRALAIIFAITVVFAVACGIAGYFSVPAYFSDDFRQMIAHDEFRPYRFICVFGVHLGGYIGGLVGCAVGIGWVLRERRRAMKRVEKNPTA